MDHCNGNMLHKSIQMESQIYDDDDSGLDMERGQNELGLLDTTNTKSIEEKRFFYDFIHLVYEEMVVKTSAGKTKGNFVFFYFS